MDTSNSVIKMKPPVCLFMTLPWGLTQWKPSEYVLAGECVTPKGTHLRRWNRTTSHLLPCCSLTCSALCELLTVLVPATETTHRYSEERGVGDLRAPGAKHR